jgi:hypothetical protein
MTMAQDFDTADYFKSNFFKATEDLGQEGAELGVTMKSIVGERVGREKELRPVLRFTDASVKPLILNKTNWSTIRNALGPPKNWPGEEIILVAKLVEFGGETTLGTRVKVSRKKPTDLDDEIPY